MSHPDYKPSLNTYTGTAKEKKYSAQVSVFGFAPVASASSTFGPKTPGGPSVTNPVTNPVDESKDESKDESVANPADQLLCKVKDIIDSYRIGLSPKALSLCKKEEERYKKHIAYAFSARKTNQSDINHLMRRCPVYFGGIKPHFLKEKNNLDKLLGYNVWDIENNLIYDIDRIYTICGEVYGEGWTKPFFVAHTWGVNFETNQTDDFKKKQDNKIYRQHYIDMFKSLKKAILFFSKNINEQIQVRVPAIGQGAFLNAINYEKSKEYNTIFMEELNKFCENINENKINAILPKYEIIFCNLYPNKYISYISDPKFKTDTDLFNVNKNITTFLVNAWDSHSFIGNGLLDDNTIDGYIVAGHGYNKYAINSSFMHNVFFQPNLQTAVGWNPDDAPAAKTNTIMSVPANPAKGGSRKSCLKRKKHGKTRKSTV